MSGFNIIILLLTLLTAFFAVAAGNPNPIKPCSILVPPVTTIVPVLS